MRTEKLVTRFAGLVAARANCAKSGNHAWFTIHGGRCDDLCREHMPSGSGVDNSTTIDLDASKPERLVFNTAFHHMDESGCYDGWTDHQIIVTPSLVFGFEVRVTGRNRNDIKDYLGEMYQEALSREVEVS